MNANILLVDDRPENLLALRAILEPLGCRLVEAHSGLEALKCLLHDEFALILLDVQMPGMDGFETAEIIKGREKTRHVPIIFVTAISKEDAYVFRGYSSGAVDYIFKPFEPDILRSKVAFFMELWAKTEQIKRQSELLRQSEERDREARMHERERALQERHLSELAASEASLSRFKSTLDATLDGVLLFDPDTLRYTYANQGALDHLGYERDELLRLTSLEIKPEWNEADYRAFIAPLRAGEMPSRLFETLHRRRDGTMVPVEIFLQYVAPPGQDGLFVTIVRDITRRKKAQAALVLAKESAERAQAEAEHANHAKSEFIASVSHELRTPLNAIVGFSKLLQNPRVGPLNEDQEAYVDDIVQSADHLVGLINDILDLSKIEAGKMTLEVGAFSLGELLEQSLMIVREKARAHRLDLRTETAPGVAALPALRGDARKLKQVLYNLLSNAVKFTPDGGSVVLSAECDDDGADAPRCAVIRVRDSGIGIAPQHLERIFHAFEQVDSSYARQQQGTGLGLALTKRIVELHGGRIEVESQEGQGSTFWFTLPLHAAQSEDASAQHDASNGAAKAKKRVRA